MILSRGAKPPLDAAGCEIQRAFPVQIFQMPPRRPPTETLL